MLKNHTDDVNNNSIGATMTEKLEGTNVFGPQVLQSWRGRVPRIL